MPNKDRMTPAAPQSREAMLAAVEALEATRLADEIGMQPNAHWESVREARRAVFDKRASALSLLRAALEAREEPPPDALRALARRCLWIAYCWNDHNFGPANEHARKEAQALGIRSFDEANAWIASPVAAPVEAPKPCIPGGHCERYARGLGACIAGYCTPPATDGVRVVFADGVKGTDRG